MKSKEELISELKMLLNRRHNAWKQLAERYGYCHPMTERSNYWVQVTRRALATLTDQEV